MFKVAQWSLNLKKNTLSDMIEHFYLFPAICQPPPLTYGFSIFRWHFALSHTSGSERRSDICPPVFFFNTFFFFTAASPPPSPPVRIRALRSRWSFLGGEKGFKKIYLFFFSLNVKCIFKSLKQYWCSAGVHPLQGAGLGPPLIRTCLHVSKGGFQNKRGRRRKSSYRICASTRRLSL